MCPTKTVDIPTTLSTQGNRALKSVSYFPTTQRQQRHFQKTAFILLSRKGAAHMSDIKSLGGLKKKKALSKAAVLTTLLRQNPF